MSQNEIKKRVYMKKDKDSGPAILIAIGKHVGKASKKADETNKMAEEQAESAQFETGEQEAMSEYCPHCKAKLKE